MASEPTKDGTNDEGMPSGDIGNKHAKNLPDIVQCSMLPKSNLAEEKGEQDLPNNDGNSDVVIVNSPSSPRELEDDLFLSTESEDEVKREYWPQQTSVRNRLTDVPDFIERNRLLKS